MQELKDLTKHAIQFANQKNAGILGAAEYLGSLMDAQELELPVSPGRKDLDSDENETLAMQVFILNELREMLKEEDNFYGVTHKKIRAYIQEILTLQT